MNDHNHTAFPDGKQSTEELVRQALELLASLKSSDETQAQNALVMKALSASFAANHQALEDLVFELFELLSKQEAKLEAGRLERAAAVMDGLAAEAGRLRLASGYMCPASVTRSC